MSTKTEHMVECLDHAMEKMIQKNAELGVCMTWAMPNELQFHYEFR